MYRTMTIEGNIFASHNFCILFIIFYFRGMSMNIPNNLYHYARLNDLRDNCTQLILTYDIRCAV